MAIPHRTPWEASALLSQPIPQRHGCASVEVFNFPARSAAELLAAIIGI